MIQSIFKQIKNKKTFLDKINKILDWKEIKNILKTKFKKKVNTVGGTIISLYENV